LSADYEVAASSGIASKAIDRRTWKSRKRPCVMREDHPDHRADDDNIVAELDASLLLLETSDEDFRLTNWNELGEAGDHALADAHFCYIFHDLFDHVLRRDRDKTLAIGGLWTDVMPIQQQMISWT
jgi:hypothetical protein